jgi:hypothetical protein
MKKLTIADISKILQLNNNYIEELSNNFSSYDEDLRYGIVEILWNGLHELKNRLAKLKYENLLLEVDEGKRQLTTDIYAQAVKAVWQDFEDILSGKKNELDQIATIKAQLQTQLSSVITPTVKLYR